MVVIVEAILNIKSLSLPSQSIQQALNFESSYMFHSSFVYMYTLWFN